MPGHEVVGRVDELGPGATRFAVGDRVGVAWLRCAPTGPAGSAVAVTRTCASRRRSPAGTSTAGTPTPAWSTSASPTALPDSFGDEHAAPLLCAGIIGYRALRLADVPAGGRLGIYGFGGSAHLTAQVALHLGLRVHVLTRGEKNRQLATELGVDSVGEATDDAPGATRRGDPVRPGRRPRAGRAARARRRGDAGRCRDLAVRHPAHSTTTRELFHERKLRSVTANTRHDGEEFLLLAERFGVAGDHAPRIRWPRLRPRWLTSRTAGSAVPPSCTTTADRARYRG